MITTTSIVIAVIIVVIVMTVFWLIIGDYESYNQGLFSHPLRLNLRLVASLTGRSAAWFRTAMEETVHAQFRV